MKHSFKTLVMAFAVLAVAVSAACAAPRTLKLAHAVTDKDAFHVGAEKIKEVIEAGSNGELEVSLFPNAQLGDERTLLENVRMGVIDMAIITGGPITSFMPEFGIFDLPFLFRDPEHAYKVLDGEIGQGILANMEKVGWKGLAYGERGFRDLTNSQHEVVKPEDMKGLKIRLMENPIYVETFRTLGANAVPMAWTETLTALQQKTIDGQENPINVIYSYQLCDSQKYITLTHHTYSPNVIMMSFRAWNSLTPEQQELVARAANEGAKANRDIDNKMTEQWLEELKAKGMVVAEPDGEAFREAVKPIYEKYGAQFGADLIKAIQEVK